MKRLALTWMSLLATGMPASGEVHAQARSSVSRAPRDQVQNPKPSDAAAPSRRLEEVEVWLRSLEGTFQLKGTVVQYINDGSQASRGIKGVMECAGIGDGPGVQCLIKASWPTIPFRVLGGVGSASPTLSEMYNTLNPAVMLFALDPEALKIKVLLVDDHSIADDLSGPLIGDTVELVSGRRGCWGPLSLPHCPWKLKITAKPGSSVIKVESPSGGGFYFGFQLHRESGPTAVDGRNSSPNRNLEK